MDVEFDLKVWAAEVQEAAHGVINPALLSVERRKWEKILAKLTTPDKCLAATRAIGWLLRNNTEGVPLTT